MNESSPSVLINDIRNKKDRKPYTKPKIIHELELEIHAGSPIPSFEDPLDPFSDN